MTQANCESTYGSYDGPIYHCEKEQGHGREHKCGSKTWISVPTIGPPLYERKLA